MAWILRLVKTGAEGDGQSTDVMEINKPDDLGDIATLGLSLAEAKLLLTGVQRESFKSRGSAQRLHSIHAAAYNTFNVQRHLISAKTHRTFRASAMDTWRAAAAAA